jgi:hypothetical protein
VNDRRRVERQGNWVFWITIASGVLIVVIALIFELVL